MLVILSRSDPCLQILHDLFYPFHNLQGEDSTCLAPICCNCPSSQSRTRGPGNETASNCSSADGADKGKKEKCLFNKI